MPGQVRELFRMAYRMLTKLNASLRRCVQSSFGVVFLGVTCVGVVFMSYLSIS